MRGVIEKVVGEQELVAYPPSRVRMDRQCRNWGYVCWLGAAILAIANIWVVVTW